jgi:hypothetical protein
MIENFDSFLAVHMSVHVRMVEKGRRKVIAVNADQFQVIGTRARTYAADYVDVFVDVTGSAYIGWEECFIVGQCVVLDTFGIIPIYPVGEFIEIGLGIYQNPVHDVFIITYWPLRSTTFTPNSETPASSSGESSIDLWPNSHVSPAIVHCETASGLGMMSAPRGRGS